MAEVIDDYVARGMRDHARSTRMQRRQQFDHLKGQLGSIRADRLQATDLTRWWTDYVVGRGLSPRTGHGHLEALARAIEFAEYTGAEAHNPVAEARRLVKRLHRTKHERQRDEENMRSLTAEEATAFAEALTKARPDVRVLGLLLLDAGLRFGEAEGVRWDACCFGDGPIDPSRRVVVREALDATGRPGSPKSGRSREVDMSTTTERHYARWTSKRYQAPLVLEAGEVPPDLLAPPATMAPPPATTAKKEKR